MQNILVFRCSSQWVKWGRKDVKKVVKCDCILSVAQNHTYIVEYNAKCRMTSDINTLLIEKGVLMCGKTHMKSSMLPLKVMIIDNWTLMHWTNHVGWGSIWNRCPKPLLCFFQALSSPHKCQTVSVDQAIKTIQIKWLKLQTPYAMCSNPLRAR